MLTRTLEAVSRCALSLPVTRKQDLEPGDWVVVSTKNSVYRLQALGGDRFQASGGWFWKPGAGAATRSLGELQTIYEESVGRNCNLELGFHPDYAGRLPSEHTTILRQLGGWISSCYKSAPLAKAGPATLRAGGTAELRLAGHAGVNVTRVVLTENQTLGQRIRAWTLSYRATAAGGWRSLASGGSIGHKRIVPVPANVTSAGMVALKRTVTFGT